MVVVSSYRTSDRTNVPRRISMREARLTPNISPLGALAWLLTAALPGCSQGRGDCPGGCAGPGFVELDLACSPSDLVGVNVSGPCIAPDAGPSGYFSGSERSALYIDSLQAGTCHVQLLFATGYSYSVDVQFTSQANDVPAGCPCSTTIQPTQQTFDVDNPAATCQDAGADASED